MKNLTIARRYAKALLMIGQQDGQAERYRAELQAVAGLVGGEPRLHQAITNPLYESSARRRVLETLIGRLELSSAMSSFLMLLFEKGRFPFLEAINDFFQKLSDELKGVGRATVTAAVDLSAEAVERIRGALSQRTGKDIVLDVRKDPELLGGVITQIGDLVLDGSIRTQLLNMRESLKRGEGI
ncbi:MAG: ATP synthase F1 subunit delta [Desulfobacterales bacterium]|jgi:F-type H+-transporting ATPase subunit delta|nr:ATP synthase F1 subunit delta [Desulfobacterales bacterium]